MGQYQKCAFSYHLLYWERGLVGPMKKIRIWLTETEFLKWGKKTWLHVSILLLTAHCSPNPNVSEIIQYIDSKIGNAWLTYNSKHVLIRCLLLQRIINVNSDIINIKTCPTGLCILICFPYFYFPLGSGKLKEIKHLTCCEATAANWAAPVVNELQP